MPKWSLKSVVVGAVVALTVRAIVAGPKASTTRRVSSAVLALSGGVGSGMGTQPSTDSTDGAVPKPSALPQTLDGLLPPKVTPITEDRRISRRFLVVIDEAEAHLDSILDKLPVTLLVLGAFGIIFTVIIIGFNVDEMPQEGWWTAMNTIFLLVVIFFGIVGLIPRTNSKLWALIGAGVGLIMWIFSNLLTSTGPMPAPMPKPVSEVARGPASSSSKIINRERESAGRESAHENKKNK